MTIAKAKTIIFFKKYGLSKKDIFKLSDSEEISVSTKFLISLIVRKKLTKECALIIKKALYFKPNKWYIDPPYVKMTVSDIKVLLNTYPNEIITRQTFHNYNLKEQEHNNNINDKEKCYVKAK